VITDASRAAADRDASPLARQLRPACASRGEIDR